MGGGWVPLQIRRHLKALLRGNLPALPGGLWRDDRPAHSRCPRIVLLTAPPPPPQRLRGPQPSPRMHRPPRAVPRAGAIRRWQREPRSTGETPRVPGRRLGRRMEGEMRGLRGAGWPRSPPQRAAAVSREEGGARRAHGATSAAAAGGWSARRRPLRGPAEGAAPYLRPPQPGPRAGGRRARGRG